MSATAPVRLVPPSIQPSHAAHPAAVAPIVVHEDRFWPAPLPLAPTPLFGRDRETELLCQLVAAGRRRLVTLTGPGGVGKTRLALRVATALADHFGGDIAFVSLAQTTDPTLLPRTIALTLGIAADQVACPVQAWSNGLAAALRDRETLLILDNMEQIVDGAPALATLLAACPSLRILTTSRIPLRLSDEQEFPVAPLAVSRETRDVSREKENRSTHDSRLTTHVSDAVALFAERARAVQPGFQLTDANAAAVAEICRRLDGLPLAIELAAARIAYLPPAALLARLERRLPLLTGGPRDAPPRQRTMRDTISWSVDLLDDYTKSVFARLGIFAGGFTLDAAESVAGGGQGWRPEGDKADALRGRGGEGGSPAAPSVSPSPPHGDSRVPLKASALSPSSSPSVLDAIGVLVDSSLLHLVATPDPFAEPRYTMLETIREYARDLLEESGEADRIARRLADWLADLNHQAAAEIRGPNQPVWLAKLDAERANFRAMTAWALDHNDAQTALSLTTKAAWFYWETRGLMREESRLLVRALDIAEANPESVDPILLGRGLMAHGMRLATTGDFAEADVRMEAAVAALQRGGDGDGVAAAQSNYATVLAERGEYARARELYEAAAEYRRHRGDPRRRVALLMNMGAMMTCEGNLDGASERLEEAQPYLDEIGEPRDSAYVRYFRGEIALYEGRISDARYMLSTALSELSQIPDVNGMAMASAHLALAHRLAGEAHDAASRVHDALERAREIGARPIAAAAIDILAGVLLDANQPESAARMLGAAGGIRDGMGTTVRPVDRSHVEGMVRQVRAALGAEAFAAAGRRGHATPADTALNEAIDLAAMLIRQLPVPAVPRNAASISGAGQFDGGLFTEREEAVLNLLVLGLSDREIGDRLFISSRTASSHVGRILAKLDVSTRTAATAVALRDGLVPV